MSQVEYMHYRPVTRNAPGGATVAILPTERNSVLVTVARCGPEDIFNKKVGRDVAAGRIRAYMEGRPTMDKYVFEVKVPDMLEVKATVAKELEYDMAELGLQ